MRKLSLLLLLLVLVFPAACTGLKGTQLATHLPAAITDTELPRNILSATLPPPAATGKAYAKKKVCPPNRKAGFGNENFLSKFMLFVVGEDNISRLDLASGKTQSRQDIAGNSSQFTTSPDNKTVAYLSLQPGSRTLWITNMVSGSPQPVALPAEAGFPRWIDNSEIAIWGSKGRLSCPYLMFIYNILTGNKIYPSHSPPELRQSDCIRIPSMDPAGTHMAFPWTTYNLATGETKTISFLQAAPKQPPAYAFQLADDQLSAFYFDEDKLHYVLSIPLDKVDDLSVNLEETSLPGFAIRDGWWERESWSADMTNIGVDLIGPAIRPLDLSVSNKNVPIDYHLLKLDSKEIIDYCLDRSIPQNNMSPGVLEGGFMSPDHRYLAWTIYDKDSHQPLESLVLDHESGLVMSIPNIKVMGWMMHP